MYKKNPNYASILDRWKINSKEINRNIPPCRWNYVWNMRCKYTWDYYLKSVTPSNGILVTFKYEVASDYYTKVIIIFLLITYYFFIYVI